MTVKELIEQLSQHPEDRLVVWPAESSGYHDVRHLEVEHVLSRTQDGPYGDLGRHFNVAQDVERASDVVCIW